MSQRAIKPVPAMHPELDGARAALHNKKRRDLFGSLLALSGWGVIQLFHVRAALHFISASLTGEEVSAVPSLALFGSLVWCV